MANEAQVSARGPCDGTKQMHPDGSYVCILVTDRYGASYRPVYISRGAASDLVDELNAILTADPERDAELERFASMTDAEVDAELRRMGSDPDVLLRKNEELVRHTVSVYLAGARAERSQAAPAPDKGQSE